MKTSSFHKLYLIKQPIINKEKKQTLYIMVLIHTYGFRNIFEACDRVA